MSTRARTSLPTFVVIGALKCGTTSLQHYLVQHPEVQMPARKETNFFSGEPEGAPYAKGHKRVASLREYEALFDPAASARGEASPNYTAHPVRRDTAKRMWEAVPEARLVYLVRDPVQRTLSHFHHRVSVEAERRPLREAFADLSDTRSIYTCASRYAMQLEQYLSYFPQEQLLVVDQADLRSNRAQTLAEIFAFLSVDHSFNSERFEEEVNTGRERRTYSSFVVWVRRAQATPLQRLPRGLRVRMRRLGEVVTSRPLPPPQADAELLARLRELYAPEAARLRTITGKTFPTWSV
ncbi:MAG TPA: sulfotransferase [Solirubrobacteraceae bacterium]